MSRGDGGLELDDIQGLVKRGYQQLAAAKYCMLTIEDAGPARDWVTWLTTRVSPAPANPDDHAVNVAFTHEGLRRLGATDHLEEDHRFALEFEGGMTTAHRRRILGDEGTSDPDEWAWGGPDNSVHCLLLLYAKDEAALDRLWQEHRAEASARGLTVTATLDSTRLSDSKEHFGFRDGMAQPEVAGLRGRVPEADRDTVARILAEGGASGNILAAGEFVLGYPNVYGKLPSSPRVAAVSDVGNHLPPTAGGSKDLGRNGSYIVMRQLRQRVHRFWECLDERTRGADGSPSPAERDRLAAKMVGRWRDGSPLVSAPDTADPALGAEDRFGYYEHDPHGERCPVGSHIRRTNPRDGLEPELAAPEVAAENSMKHRLLRRGRAYGPPVAPSMAPEDILGAGPHADETDRGLHFLVLNANIGRQFEFVQQSWVNNPKFGGLYSETDPLLGLISEETTARGIGGDFTIPGLVREKHHGLERFVDVVGGAYFFLPSLSALRYLGAGAGS